MPDDTSSANVTTSVPQEHISWLDKEAKSRGVSRSVVLRDIIAEGVKRARMPKPKEGPKHSQRCEYCEGTGQVAVMFEGEHAWWICAKCNGNGSY